MPAITMISSLLRSGNRCINYRQHHRIQVRAAGQDLLTARRQFTFGPDRQGEQVQQGIQLAPAAELLQVDPGHLRVLLQKAVGLRRQAVVEAEVGVHLHLQQHHWELLAASFGAAGALTGPEHAVEAVAQLLELQGFKSVEAVTRG
jgi:hypothetical protein